MSGKYLHGLLIKEKIVVEDNVFSYTELRERYTLLCRNDTKSHDIYEWSWDYVTRQFAETLEGIEPLAQHWIDKNLATYTQLRDWLGRNWEGLVCRDEPEREIYIWKLLNSPSHPDPTINTFLQAAGARDQAYQAWKQAYPAWDQAAEAWKQADKEWKTRVMKPVFFELLDREKKPDNRER